MAKHVRTTAEEAAKRLHGTAGRVFVRRGEKWLDTETGSTGALHDLAEKWNAERPIGHTETGQPDEG